MADAAAAAAARATAARAATPHVAVEAPHAAIPSVNVPPHAALPGFNVAGLPPSPACASSHALPELPEDLYQPPAATSVSTCPLVSERANRGPRLVSERAASCEAQGESPQENLRSLRGELQAPLCSPSSPSPSTLPELAAQPLAVPYGSQLTSPLDAAYLAAAVRALAACKAAELRNGQVFSRASSAASTV